MTAPDDAIRARRKLTNKLIAGHDAARLKPFFVPEATLISGDGGVLLGAGAILDAFAGQFRDPSFVTYVRSPERVDLDAEGARAAEAGTWRATWKDAAASGIYLAVWRKVTGQWLIESELYVTLA